jgi:hypothetical protein
MHGHMRVWRDFCERHGRGCKTQSNGSVLQHRYPWNLSVCVHVHLCTHIRPTFTIVETCTCCVHIKRDTHVNHCLHCSKCIPTADWGHTRHITIVCVCVLPWFDCYGFECVTRESAKKWKCTHSVACIVCVQYVVVWVLFVGRMSV